MKSVTSMVKASQLLYNNLSAKLNFNYDHYVNVLKESISLVLFSIAHLKERIALDPGAPEFEANERSKEEDIVKAAFGGLEDTLWKWITDISVIGGSVFGGRIIKYEKLDMAEKEFKVDTCNLYILY